MIQVFKRNLFFNSILLLGYAIVLRIHFFVAPLSGLSSGQHPIQEWILSWGGSPMSQQIIATLILFFQAVFINRIVITNRLSNQITLLPGMVYLFLCSILPATAPLSLVLIANTFLLIALARAFKVYRSASAAVYVFDIGLYVGIASIIYEPSLVMAVLAYLSLVIMRTVKWSDRVQLLAGMVCPYYLWYVSVAFTGTDTAVISYLGSIFTLALPPTSQVLALVVLIVTVLLSLIQVFNYSAYTGKKSIQVQKKIDILYWFLLLTGVGTVLAHSTIDHVLMLAIPLSFFLSQSILRFGNLMTAELIHLAFVVLILCYHFGLFPSF